MVLITHDNSIAVKAKRIVRLQDGRIIYDGDASDPAAVVQPEETGADGEVAYELAQSFKLALKSLKTSKMRAFLTMLGYHHRRRRRDRDSVSRQRHDQYDEQPV